MASTDSGVSMAAYAAPSLFQPHRARDAIRDAHKKKIAPLLGYYAGLSSIPITRFLAPMNFDVVWIDWEHTSCNVETMTTMVHEAIFMSQGRTMPFVRVPGHDHAAIGYALDAGASIVVPQVDTVEQALHVVSAAKFGTRQRGTRSAPPFRLIPFLTDTPYDSSRDIYTCLNDQAAIMIQIETLEGINNLDAILTEVPDIDIVWLGSLDARISMNLPGNFGLGGDEPEWIAATDKFFKVLDKHDKPYGGFSFVQPPFGSAEGFKKATERMSFVMASADVMHLANLNEDLKIARGLVEEVRVANGATKNGDVSRVEKLALKSNAKEIPSESA
ncbi:hpcH/HpaI aldolase/citrate lyase family protein [Hirsutella rhossiliensis]|uniref:HpcH/HpaI aldolase/citrate lyase family domain-containing protein n=1 Tax=Hirsutella rhossiliensis TaxID=111463 RepID=A0A9P8N3M8_9HYPO|nr:hpcH/HpaI aldolase/citrate lyase family domain-containing protein [Hirsutella rhossiliensis]KAH0966300.1 hpcH/HpaI aldolase/citrate lyase family domain-containing protein [Hirsutella rhossiliensis]